MFTDKFGRKWNIPEDERCPECGQPDSCGDCNHKKLTDEEVLQLGGILPSKMKDRIHKMISTLESLEDEALKGEACQADVEEVAHKAAKLLKKIAKEGCPKLS